MATQESLTTVTLIAGADLSAKQYLFVELANDGQIDPVGSAGGDAVGVLQNDPDAAGKAATVAISGISKVVCGGTVTVGDKVQSDNAGKALTAASGDHVLGRALATGASGEIIPVLLINHHILA